MQTLLLYLLIMALVVAVVFAVVWFVFGRGEDLPPLEPDTTLTRLPRKDITGEDIRALRFQQALRGYKQSEVDWALARLAREVDDLRAALAALSGSHGPAGVEETGSQIRGASSDFGAGPTDSTGVAGAWEHHETRPPEP